MIPLIVYETQPIRWISSPVDSSSREKSISNTNGSTAPVQDATTEFPYTLWILLWRHDLRDMNGIDILNSSTP